MPVSALPFCIARSLQDFEEGPPVTTYKVAIKTARKPIIPLIEPSIYTLSQ
jgi:hypothetical protein